MPLRYRHLICAVFLSIPLYVHIVCPAPSLKIRRHPVTEFLQKRQHATSLIDQASSWANDHSPALHGISDPGTPPTAALVPVSDVFRIMADAGPDRPQADTQKKSTNPPTNPPSNLPPPQDPAPAPHNAAPTAPHHPSGDTHSPTNPQSGHPHESEHHAAAPAAGEGQERGTGADSEENSSEVDHKKNLAPVGKLILIALVMAGIITLIFCIYFLVDRRALACCCRKKKSGRNKTWKIEDSVVEEPKEPVKPIVWSKFTSPQDQACNFAQHSAHQNFHNNDTDNIAPGLPPSRYPITAKPYPFSARGSSFSSTVVPQVQVCPAPPCPVLPTPRSPLSKSPPICAEEPSSEFRLARRSSTPAPLLPPNEFFCMHSPSESTFHARSSVKSNPIFGHIIARCLPDIKKLRSGDHRKSKSVSGLVYIVDTEKAKGRETTIFNRWSSKRAAIF